MCLEWSPNPFPPLDHWGNLGFLASFGLPPSQAPSPSGSLAVQLVTGVPWGDRHRMMGLANRGINDHQWPCPKGGCRKGWPWQGCHRGLQKHPRGNQFLVVWWIMVPGAACPIPQLHCPPVHHISTHEDRARRGLQGLGQAGAPLLPPPPITTASTNTTIGTLLWLRRRRRHRGIATHSYPNTMGPYCYGSTVRSCQELVATCQLPPSCQPQAATQI